MSTIDRIRKLLNASTPGPWWSGMTTSDERIVAFVSDGTGETHDDIHADMHVARDEGEPNANGLLIAEMRAALPALLDLADAARGVTDVDESNDVEWCPVCDCATDNCYCPLSDVRDALSRLDGDAEGE